MVGYWF